MGNEGLPALPLSVTGVFSWPLSLDRLGHSKCRREAGQELPVVLVPRVMPWERMRFSRWARTECEVVAVVATVRPEANASQDNGSYAIPRSLERDGGARVRLIA